MFIKLNKILCVRYFKHIFIYLADIIRENYRSSEVLENYFIIFFSVSMEFGQIIANGLNAVQIVSESISSGNVK